MLEIQHFRIHSEKVETEELRLFSEHALAAWNFVLRELDTPMSDGWPTNWPHHLPRVIDIRIDDVTKIPGSWWRPGAIDIFIPTSKFKQQRDSCIAHELTHLLAPSQGKHDRLFDEGLAVHVQALFDDTVGDCSYPTFGRNLHDETRISAREALGYIPLKNVEEVRNADQTGPMRRLAYLQEGSFVRYLIEGFGIESYLSMHFGQTSEESFGLSMISLEENWKDFLEATDD